MFVSERRRKPAKGYKWQTRRQTKKAHYILSVGQRTSLLHGNKKERLSHKWAQTPSPMLKHELASKTDPRHCVRTFAVRCESAPIHWSANSPFFCATFLLQARTISSRVSKRLLLTPVTSSFAMQSLIPSCKPSIHDLRPSSRVFSKQHCA